MTSDTGSTDTTEPGEATASGGEDYDDYLGPGVKEATSKQGGVYFYKASELLVADDDLAPVQGRLHEWSQLDPAKGPERLTPTSKWWRVPLGSNSDDVPDLIARLRVDESAYQAAYDVYPNHVFHGNPHGGWPGTGSPPRAAVEALSALPPMTAHSGRRVKVAVLDTGDFFKHQWLNGRVTFVAPPGATESEGYDPDEVLPRYAGHWAFSAGLILQHAPWAEVVVDQLLNGHGEATDTEIAAAIRRCADDVDIDIIHLSVAAPTFGNRAPPATTEALAELRVQRPTTQVVAPAGNGFSEVPWFPGALNGVIAVAALEARPDRWQKAFFSNHGEWVDACAHGADAKSTFLTFTGKIQKKSLPAGQTPPEWWDKTQAFEGWAYWSGTCFSAARVTGVIAEAMSANDVDAATAATTLLRGGQARLMIDEYDLGVPFYDTGRS